MQEPKDNNRDNLRTMLSANPSLENLPFEIQRLIMSHAPTFDTLSALVHASPRFHSVYVQDRLQILRGLVQRILGDVLVDAHAAYLSGREDFQLNRTEPMIWELAEAYQHRLSTVAAPDLAAQLSLEDATQMIRFHRSIVEPLTERYAIWALAALSSSPEKWPLSGTETRRIQRGLCRYQLFCNLCSSHQEGRARPCYIRDHVQRLGILCFFPAWQVEEILCIQAFAKDTYGGVFHQVAWDLDEKRNPRYQHIDRASVNEDLLFCSGVKERKFNISLLFRWRDIIRQIPTFYLEIDRNSLEYMLRLGLPVLSAIFKSANHEELVQLVRRSIESFSRPKTGDMPYYGWMDEAVDQQHVRREMWYSEHDLAQDWREKTPFDKDGLDQPPLGWVVLWKGEASNLFGSFVRETYRRWGFVMWDAARLKASGALAYMEKEEEWLGRRDPREENYLTEDSETDAEDSVE